MVKCDIEHRFQYILYLISVGCSILSTTLTIIDKKDIDIFNIIDIILGSLLLLSLTFSITLLKDNLNEVFLGINAILWMANNILGFFSYKDSRSTDFLGVCIFLRVIRIISVLACMIFITFILDEE